MAPRLEMDVQAGKQACERTTIGQEFLVTRAKSGLNSVGNGSSIEVDFRKRAFILLYSAISLGGDADTMAAIAGGIAEAFWGVPADIEEKAMTYLHPQLRGVVEEFQNTT